MKSVSIIGPNGQLGTDLVKIFTNAGWKVNQITHKQIIVEKIDSVSDALKKNKADWIINTAAFHKVEECEKDPERAWLINATGPQNVAQVANELGSRVVFISSDYVFSGSLPIELSYKEHHNVSPVNSYGHSKAAGEVATLSANLNNLVVRISSVFGAAGSSGKGGNFVETIINKARAGDAFDVVDDIFMSPTYSVDASRKVLELLTHEKHGIYNSSNAGVTSWFGLATEILNLTKLKTSITPSKSNKDSFPKRPRNSSLDTSKVERILSESPTWPEGLRNYLIERGHLE